MSLYYPTYANHRYSTQAIRAVRRYREVIGESIRLADAMCGRQPRTYDWGTATYTEYRNASMALLRAQDGRKRVESRWMDGTPHCDCDTDDFLGWILSHVGGRCPHWTPEQLAAYERYVAMGRRYDHLINRLHDRLSAACAEKERYDRRFWGQSYGYRG